MSKTIFQLKAKLIFKENSTILAGNSTMYLQDSDYNGEISSEVVSTHICSINSSTNNVQIKVYPGKTIATDLRAFDF